MDKTLQEQTFDSNNLIVFILKRWKSIFAITAVGAVISIIASLVIVPKFKSTVIMFPATSGSISKALLTESTSNKDLLVFGEEEEVEQMMQVLLSEELKELVIDRFSLYEHYEIDSSTSYPRTKMQKLYDENVKISRTRFMSIQIDVLDRDPVLAADLANGIAAYVDTMMNNIKQKRAKKALEIVEREYYHLNKQVEEYERQFREIRQKGINNYESQSEVYNDAYAVALAAGKTSGAKILEEKLQILSEYGGEYVKVRDRYYMANKRFGVVSQQYDLAKVDAEEVLPHTYIVESGKVAEKKAYPIRWLIVVVSTMSTFIFSVLLLLIIDAYNKNWKKQL